MTYNNKLNAKNKIQVGTKYSLFDYDNKQSMLQDDLATRTSLVDFDESIGVVRNCVNWKHRLNDDITVVAGIHNYFAQVETAEGSISEPNKDLDLLKAHHFVLGYEKRFAENLMAKVEVYYQHLYNLPVENNHTSYYSTINEGLEYRYVDLVN